jgi:hypothetical protein
MHTYWFVDTTNPHIVYVGTPRWRYTIGYKTTAIHHYQQDTKKVRVRIVDFDEGEHLPFEVFAMMKEKSRAIPNWKQYRLSTRLVMEQNLTSSQV